MNLDNIIKPRVTYSVAIHDEALIITPGDANSLKEKEEAESLCYKFPEGELMIKKNNIHITANYKTILDQPLPKEILNSDIDVDDIEFVFYQGSPYIYYNEYNLLLIRVPEALFEVLDPVDKTNYFVSIIENKVYLISNSYCNRTLTAKPMKLTENTEFIVVDKEDRRNMIEKSYFKKRNIEIYLNECHLTSHEGNIILVTNKYHENLATGLAQISENEMIL